MRHLFDQYEQPENRLTHALACCLKENQKLLRDFVHWTDPRITPSRRRMVIDEQVMPGDAEISEEDSEKRGLPDICIHDDSGWAMLIENKIGTPISNDQLRRHRETARRRGITKVFLLVISPNLPAHRLPDGVQHLEWSTLYDWFKKKSNNSEWSQRLTSYMEILEANMINSGILEKGTITTFTGINFNADSPYNYHEAKRILNLAMAELRKDKKLIKLGMDPAGKGRSAITGSKGQAVWDFLPVKQASKADNFTQFPHLTLVIQSNRVIVIVTIPNGIKSEFRHNIRDIGQDSFENLIFEVTDKLERLFKKTPEATPWIEVIQRHYPSQRSPAIMDARLEFDPRTALGSKMRRGKSKCSVKPQPQWLAATYDALTIKKSNLQVGIGAMIPHSCPMLHSKKALNIIAETWIACKPFLKAILD